MESDDGSSKSESTALWEEYPTYKTYMNGHSVEDQKDPEQKAEKSVDLFETVSITNCYYQHKIEAEVEKFPNVRFLSISRITHRTSAEILSILRRCQHLDTFTIDSFAYYAKNEDDEKIKDYKLNAGFHDEFIKTIGNPDIKMVLKNEGETIGVITKDVIIWRNKLLHWVGHDPIHNHSDIRLLDLASIPKESTAKHKQPLNLIFNYLDLNSLYAFCGASKQCKQLVHSYIYQKCKWQSKRGPSQRSIERSKLMITDEFGINYNSLRLFGKCISNLEVNLLGFAFHRLKIHIEKYCKHLSHLTLRIAYWIDSYSFIFPQIRHFIFYGYGLTTEYRFCNLNELARRCPKLEVLELRTPTKISLSYIGKQYAFENLRKIKLNPHEESDIKLAENYIKSPTEIIVLNRIILIQ